MKDKVWKCDCGHTVPEDEIYGIAKVNDTGYLDLCIACRSGNPNIQWAEHSPHSDLCFSSLQEQHKYNAKGNAYN